MGQLWLVFTLSSTRGGGGKNQPEREREYNSCQIRPADKISELAVIRREKMYLACNELNCYLTVWYAAQVCSKYISAQTTGLDLQRWRHFYKLFNFPPDFSFLNFINTNLSVLWDLERLAVRHFCYVFIFTLLFIFLYRAQCEHDVNIKKQFILLQWQPTSPLM